MKLPTLLHIRTDGTERADGHGGHEPLKLVSLFLASVSAAAGGFAWWWERQLLPHEEQSVAMPLLVSESPPVAVPEIEAAAPAEAVDTTPGAAGARRPYQLTTEGTGLIFHRHYRADIAQPALEPEALMAHIQQNLSEYMPPLFVRVEKEKGEPGTMAVGDEYFIHLAGPWSAPVTVIDVQPDQFAFITRRGHLETGEILFRARPHPEQAGSLRFEILEWTRSSTRFINLIYDRLDLLRQLQKDMWTYFTSRAVEKSGGELVGKMEIMTEQSPFAGEIIPEEEGAAGIVEETAAPWERYRAQIERLKGLPINFDLTKKHTYTEESGWKIDNWLVELPPEPPGEPVEGGSWETAKQIVHDYEFPDPDIVSGFFAPDDPLGDRVLLLEARWLFLTFQFGTRVGDLIDEVRQTEAGPARVWGYSYRTLEEHIEMGEMTFEVWKFLESGRVEFRIHAYSRAAASANPILRLGFRIFGRPLQKRYARRALERMQQLVVERLAAGRAGAKDETGRSREEAPT
ncbi:MAG: DUF1990 family protein [Candidatus Promineifilaceae bacterium]|nr:DUF1990 family protein [Candidatus Promineifilaceae bacterium]